MTYSRTSDLLNQAKSLLDQARSAAEGEDQLPGMLCRAISSLVGRTEHVQWRVDQRIRARERSKK